MCKIRSSRKINYGRLFSRAKYFPKTFSLTENQFSGKTYLHTIGPRMLYIGAMDQYYTWTMFDAQAKWAVQYLMGKIKLPEREAMLEEIKQWTKRWVPDTKDTTCKQDFRNRTFVTLKWKYFSIPLHMLISQTNQIFYYDQSMKSDQSDCLL